jgi:hypothetical protein
MGARPRYGSATASPVEVLDRDQVMKESFRREAVESLSQQLAAERQEQAGIGQAETLTALLVTTVVGLAVFSALTKGGK